MELSFALCLPRDGTSVPFVRHLLRATLQRLGIEDECVHDIEIALSEACTNVLRHAGTEDEYQVDVEVDDQRCRITVSDAGEGFELGDPRDESTPIPSEGGRGIQLMRALVDGLHFESDMPGTVVELTKTLELQPSSVLRRMTPVQLRKDTDELLVDPLQTGAQTGRRQPSR
jgi:serine/threonine-protein kinase RsbW